MTRNSKENHWARTYSDSHLCKRRRLSKIQATNQLNLCSNLRCDALWLQETHNVSNISLWTRRCRAGACVCYQLSIVFKINVILFHCINVSAPESMLMWLTTTFLPDLYALKTLNFLFYLNLKLSRGWGRISCRASVVRGMLSLRISATAGLSKCIRVVLRLICLIQQNLSLN